MGGDGRYQRDGEDKKASACRGDLEKRHSLLLIPLLGGIRASGTPLALALPACRARPSVGEMDQVH